MPFVSKLGNGGFIFILIGILLLIKKETRKMALTILVALLFGLLIGNLFMKPFFARTRPYDINTEIALLIPKLNDFSFPSGHTLAAFEFAVSVFLYNKRFGILAVVFAFIMAFSRLYLYVHFPTDVFAGMILGSLFAYFSYKIINNVINKNRLC